MTKGTTEGSAIMVMKYLRTHGDFDRIRKVLNSFEHQSASLHAKFNVFGSIVPAPAQSTSNLLIKHKNEIIYQSNPSKNVDKENIQIPPNTHLISSVPSNPVIPQTEGKKTEPLV